MKTLKLFFALTLFCLSSAAHAFMSLPSSSKGLVRSNLNDVNIFSNDNRKIIEEFNFPWSAVGYLSRPELKDGKLGHAGCTASLVGPDLILTNAHCILKDGAVVESDVRFSLHFNGTKKIRARYEAMVTKVEAIGATQFNSGRGQPDDWAILRLDRKLGDVVGWLGVRPRSGEELIKRGKFTTYYMIGYSRDRSGLPLMQKCEIRDSADEQIFHNCSGVEGSSGSPILHLETRSDGQVMGVIVGLQWGSSRRHDISEYAKQDYSLLGYRGNAVNAQNFYEKLRDILAADEGR